MSSPDYKAMSTIHGGYLRVEDYRGKYGIINKEGDIIVPVVCDYLGSFHQPNLDITYVGIRGNEMRVDLQGNLYTVDHKPIPCENCACYNDKLISGFCCQFFKGTQNDE